MDGLPGGWLFEGLIFLIMMLFQTGLRRATLSPQTLSFYTNLPSSSQLSSTRQVMLMLVLSC